MKTTRNLFILNGEKTDVQKALHCLLFKGLVIFENKVSEHDVKRTFGLNKSIACSYQQQLEGLPHISVNVVNGSCSLADNLDYIDLSDSSSVANQFESIAQKHNCDIGDLKSNDSGANGAPKISDCSYCNQFHDTDEYCAEYNRIIYESKSFFVFPTLGEFIKGYLLIVPKEHVMSMAELDLETFNEFLVVLEDCRFIINLAYGRPDCSSILVWENGTGNSGKGKAKDSVVHAHVHIAPSNLTAAGIEQLSGIRLKNISNEEIHLYGNHSYLLIQNEDMNSWKINDNPDVYIPRQFIRQILAEEFNIPGERWNWRKYGYIDLILETKNDINAALKKHWNDLPLRIKNSTEKFL